MLIITITTIILNSKKSSVITGEEGLYGVGASKICHTARLLMQSKPIANGKYPGLTFYRFSDLGCSRQHTEIVQNILQDHSVSQPYTWFVWHLLKNCHFPAMPSFLTKTDLLHACLPSLEKNGIHFGLMRAIIPPEILKGCSKRLMTCNDQVI